MLFCSETSRLSLSVFTSWLSSLMFCSWFFLRLRRSSLVLLSLFFAISSSLICVCASRSWLFLSLSVFSSSFLLMTSVLLPSSRFFLLFSRLSLSF